MADNILNHNGKKLVPVQIDSHTWVLLPPDKATQKHIKAYKESVQRSRELAVRRYPHHDYDD